MISDPGGSETTASPTGLAIVDPLGVDVPETGGTVVSEAGPPSLSSSPPLQAAMSAPRLRNSTNGMRLSRTRITLSARAPAAISASANRGRRLLSRTSSSRNPILDSRVYRGESARDVRRTRSPSSMPEAHDDQFVTESRPSTTVCFDSRSAEDTAELSLPPLQCAPTDLTRRIDGHLATANAGRLLMRLHDYLHLNAREHPDGEFALDGSRSLTNAGRPQERHREHGPRRLLRRSAEPVAARNEREHQPTLTSVLPKWDQHGGVLSAFRPRDVSGRESRPRARLARLGELELNGPPTSGSCLVV